MPDEYLTKERLQSITSKDVIVDKEKGIKVKIRALDPVEFIELLPKDLDVDASNAEAATEELAKRLKLSENIGLINEIVLRGLILPKVSRDGAGDTISINELGGLKLPIMNAILEFSGLKGDKIEPFLVTPG